MERVRDLAGIERVRRSARGDDARERARERDVGGAA